MECYLEVLKMSHKLCQKTPFLSHCSFCVWAFASFWFVLNPMFPLLTRLFCLQEVYGMFSSSQLCLYYTSTRACFFCFIVCPCFRSPASVPVVLSTVPLPPGRVEWNHVGAIQQVMIIYIIKHQLTKLKTKINSVLE